LDRTDEGFETEAVEEVGDESFRKTEVSDRTAAFFVVFFDGFIE
jgi:hypothetical protein